MWADLGGEVSEWGSWWLRKGLTAAFICGLQVPVRPVSQALHRCWGMAVTMQVHCFLYDSCRAARG